MSANLVIAHSNPQPKRSRRYPSTWLFYSLGREFHVRVKRDRNYSPHVLNKRAA